MKRKIAWKRIFGLLLKIIMICCYVWFFASIIDTNICNRPFTEHYQDFASWNLFNILF